MIGRRLLLAAALASWMSAAASTEQWELALKRGEDGRYYDGTGVALRLAPAWEKDWGSWHFSLSPEVELNRFHYTGPNAGPRHMNQAGISAQMRVYFGDRSSFRPHADIGLGFAGFNHNRLGSKDFSTHFQFSEHVGLGVEVDERWQIGWRYSHYSNANIERPNAGIDLHQIVIGLRF